MRTPCRIRVDLTTQEQPSTSAEVSGQFGSGAEEVTDTSALVPKCLGSELSWVRDVPTPTLTQMSLLNTLPKVFSKPNVSFSYEFAIFILILLAKFLLISVAKQQTRT